MRRFIALGMIAALLSVSSLPLLPSSVACAHGVGQMENCDDCHEGMNHSMTMKHGTEHSMHHDDAASHQHSKKLSPAEKECRIECGCGCNASLDNLPYQLAPHALAPVFKLTPEFTAVEPVALASQMVFFPAAPPSPPPKPFSI